MDRNRSHIHFLTTLLVGLAFAQTRTQAQDPPALNPFGPSAPTVGQRDDARLGTVTLSDDSKLIGDVYLTRDARLEIEDQEQKRKRSVPLEVVNRIDAIVLREWVEREWRFSENASDTKVYTGRTYPAREVAYKLTLRDGRTIQGDLAALVYLRAEGEKPRKFILHKRDKGVVGADLKSLIYVKSITFEKPDAETDSEPPK